MIRHVLEAFRSAGLREAVVVVGYLGDQIRKALRGYRDLAVTVVDNPDWQKSNGVSMLAAAPWVDRPCILSMADHMYEGSLVERLRRAGGLEGTCYLGVDDDIGGVFDIDDATKVRRSGDWIVEISKELEGYDGIDTGVFRITPALIEALGAEFAERGDCSLSDGVRRLAVAGKMRAVPVTGSLWIDVDTPMARRYAEAVLRVRELERGADQPYLLMNPGPVTMSPGVRQAIGSRDICHRDADFSELFSSVRRKLSIVYGAHEHHEVLVLNASGTGAVETMVSSFVPAAGKLLVVRNGAFGERIAQIARTHHVEVSEVEFGWGELVDLHAVVEALDADPSITTVAMVHHETSVGLLNPVAALGAICRERGKVLLVDAVSSLGGEDIDVERDGIDVCASSANKCLHGVSGVSFLAVSERAWSAIDGDPPRGYYFDARRYRAYLPQAQTPFTPAVQGLLALDQALTEALELGLDRRRARYRELCAAIRTGLRSLGLSTLTQTGSESHVITLAEVPPGIAYRALYDEMKGRGFVIYECKGALADRYFQVANLGDMGLDDVRSFLSALREVVSAHGAIRPAASGPHAWV
jgi:2-aminoethylphosphonate-pyruvate transaminase